MEKFKIGHKYKYEDKDGCCVFIIREKSLTFDDPLSEEDISFVYFIDMLESNFFMDFNSFEEHSFVWEHSKPVLSNLI